MAATAVAAAGAPSSVVTTLEYSRMERRLRRRPVIPSHAADGATAPPALPVGRVPTVAPAPTAPPPPPEGATATPVPAPAPVLPVPVAVAPGGMLDGVIVPSPGFFPVTEPVQPARTKPSRVQLPINLVLCSGLMETSAPVGAQRALRDSELMCCVYRARDQADRLLTAGAQETQPKRA